MKGRARLRWLLAVVVALVVLRWLVPPASSDNDGSVAQAIVRQPTTGASAPVASLVDSSGDGLPQVNAASVEDTEPAANPFAVRTPPPPPAPVPAPVVAVQAPPVVQAPPPVPVIPPPPLKVIGTWDDGSGLAAFVAGPNVTLLARPGVVLMGEYSVTAVTKQQVTLVHVPSKRDVRLPVPRAPGA